MRILYSGRIGRWSTTEARLHALRGLGHDVEVLDINASLAGAPAWLRKIELHAADGPHLRAYNRALRRVAGDGRWDLIWLDTGACVRPRTVAALREAGAPILSYNSDYLRFHRHAWRQYLAAVPFYDVHVTTNGFNVPELERRGARSVVMTSAAFDPDLHRPVDLNDAERARLDADVTFVGHFEPAYARALTALHDAGLTLKIWGPGWSRSAARSRLESALQQPAQVWGPDAVKAVAAGRVCVGLLSAHNRNQSNGRSYEIPAVGSLLLAERTDEHAALYREGVEAEFFSTLDELVEKARYYVAHARERAALALGGHRRRWSSGGTHRDRVTEILAAI